ncbi:MAG: UPF0280 family protein [Pseudomonadota bacterium]
MWMPPTYQVLKDGRAHFNHGPIDLVISIQGRDHDVAEATDRAWHRFSSILNELVEELAALREPVRVGQMFSSPVARRMQKAVEPFAGTAFVTSMAAVAGAVADEICDVISDGNAFDKVHVNNGGDIALHLDGSQTMRVGMVPDQVIEGGVAKVQGTVDIRPGDGIGGIATSGRHGRSFSLGIADAVTVLATDAAAADVAATLIANSVDIESDKISRTPAVDLDPDSDLGDRPVTVEVATLTNMEIMHALGNGEARAQNFLRRGFIRAAALHLGGETRVISAPEDKLIQQEDYAWT